MPRLLALSRSFNRAIKLCAHLHVSCRAPTVLLGQLARPAPFHDFGCKSEIAVFRHPCTTRSLDLWQQQVFGRASFQRDPCPWGLPRGVELGTQRFVVKKMKSHVKKLMRTLALPRCTFSTSNSMRGAAYMPGDLGA